MRLSVLALSLVFSSIGGAQSGTIVFRESFGFGVNDARPKSGKGRMTPVFAGTGVGGFWAEFPADKSTSWMSVDVSGVPGWNFAATSPNPYEAPSPLQANGNGTAWCFNDVGAFRAVNLLAPINSPRTRFAISAELMPRPILGHSTALGLTNSNVLEDNFEGSATVWVRILAQETGVQGSGRAEFRTRGLTGPSVSATVPVDFNGFNPVEIVVDPVGLTATAKVNGIVLGTLPVPAGTTKYAGVEGSGGVDDLVVRVLP
jgi:hypothetical protein